MKTFLVHVHFISGVCAEHTIRSRTASRAKRKAITRGKYAHTDIAGVTVGQA